MTRGFVKVPKGGPSHRVSLLFFLQFLANAKHDVKAVVNTNRQQEDGDGIHRSVERHVHAGELQPSREAVGGGNGDHRENEHVGGLSNAAEVEPQNDAQQQHGGTGQHADFLANGGAVVFSELSEGKGTHVAVVGRCDDLKFHGFGPSRQISLYIAQDFVIVVKRFTRDHQRDHHRAVGDPRVTRIVAWQAREDGRTEINRLEPHDRTKLALKRSGDGEDLPSLSRGPVLRHGGKLPHQHTEFVAEVVSCVHTSEPCGRFAGVPSQQPFGRYGVNTGYVGGRRGQVAKSR